MNELPEGVRLLLVAGLELCGAVLLGEPREELLARAEGMQVLVGEHVVLEGE